MGLTIVPLPSGHAKLIPCSTATSSDRLGLVGRNEKNTLCMTSFPPITLHSPRAHDTFGPQ